MSTCASMQGRLRHLASRDNGMVAARICPWSKASDGMAQSINPNAILLLQEPADHSEVSHRSKRHRTFLYQDGGQCLHAVEQSLASRSSNRWDEHQPLFWSY